VTVLSLTTSLVSYITHIHPYYITHYTTTIHNTTVTKQAATHTDEKETLEISLTEKKIAARLLEIFVTLDSSKTTTINALRRLVAFTKTLCHKNITSTLRNLPLSMRPFKI
jgi:hypothetical protein